MRKLVLLLSLLLLGSASAEYGVGSPGPNPVITPTGVGGTT